MKRDLMGLADIIRHYGWNKNTVYGWHSRKKLPRPDLEIRGRKFWTKKTMDAFVPPDEKRRGAK